MSTDILILGISAPKEALYIASGAFGGCLPFFYDLIHRQKMPEQEKIDLNLEFYLIKAVIIPILALTITAFAVAFENVNSWVAAVYLGASLPILIEKAIGASVV